MRPLTWQLALLALAGVLAVSTSAVFIRLALESAQSSGPGFSLVMAAMRLSIAALLLLPAWQALPKTQLQPGAWPLALGAGVFLALHFATWITSFSYTSIAASTTLVNTNPIWVALLSWWLFKEKPSGLTLWGIGVAFGGGLVIALAEPNSAGNNAWLGNGLALLGALAVSLYYLMGREAQKRGFGLGLYIAVAYGAAAIVLLPLPFFFQTPYLGYPPITYFWILLMALLPQLVGHSSFNYLVRHIPAVLVTLLLLFEPVGASLLGFAVFGELPSATVLLGAGVILMGIALAAIGSRR